MKNKLSNRRVLRSMVMTVLFFSAIGLSACKDEKSSEEKDVYTCPMHPTVISDRKASCPVCGMDLVRKARPGEEVEITEELSKLLKSPNEAVTASIETVKPQYGTRSFAIEADGVVSYDTRQLSVISARAAGRVEKSFLKYEYQPVKKGQRVVDIYSADLVTAQGELLLVLASEGAQSEMAQAARQKVLQLGMSEPQLNEVIESKRVAERISLFSPVSGYVILSESTVAPSASVPSASSSGGMGSGGMDGGMGSGSSTQQEAATPASSSAEVLTEGSYVGKGQKLFSIVNDQSLRLEFLVASSSATHVRVGDNLKVDVGGEAFDARIDLVEPFYQQDQSFTRLRVYTPKRTELHPGHLVRALIVSGGKESLWVPRQAVVELGLNHAVFIKKKNAFQPRRVVVGATSKDSVQVLSGLASSDEVAANAQYLVDSESFIKVK